MGRLMRQDKSDYIYSEFRSFQWIFTDPWDTIYFCTALDSQNIFFVFFFANNTYQMGLPLGKKSSIFCFYTQLVIYFFSVEEFFFFFQING